MIKTEEKRKKIKQTNHSSSEFYLEKGEWKMCVSVSVTEIFQLACDPIPMPFGCWFVS